MQEPIWLSVSRMQTGIAEIPGPQSAPVILGWARDLGIADIYQNDDTAWCALYINRVMKACQLPTSGSEFTLLRAAEFVKWGQPLRTPSLGAVMVFKRDGGFHVGIYVGERDDAYRIHGGNQANAVNEIWKRKTELVEQGIRWPLGVARPTTGAIWLTQTGGTVSTNEA